MSALSRDIRAPIKAPLNVTGHVSCIFSLLQLLCSLAVSIISGLIMGKTDTGKANTAIVVLGAVAAALTTLLTSRDYDGKAGDLWTFTLTMDLLCTDVDVLSCVLQQRLQLVAVSANIVSQATVALLSGLYSLQRCELTSPKMDIYLGPMSGLPALKSLKLFGGMFTSL